MDCPPVTYSIDTTGLDYPGRASVANRRALKQWTAMTGIPFVYQPSGGLVSVVFRTIKDEWAAYALGNVIVVDPRWIKESVLAHEWGHILGIPHTSAPDMLMTLGGFMDKVTPADAELARCPA